MTTFPFPQRRSPLLALVEILSDRNWRLKRPQWDGGPGLQAHDAAGRPFETDPLQVNLLPQPPELAAALGEGPVVERRRRHLIGGVPVQLSVSWYRADTGAAGALMAGDTGPGGALARLAEAGLTAKRFREEVTPRLPAAEERDALEQSSLEVVAEIIRHAMTGNGTVIEVTQMVVCGWYTLKYEIEA